ncbi:MAG: hypothetical protein IT538_08890 [Variibacter sp.]|nr:hypothetical protein [Variibacter sp.]
MRLRKQTLIQARHALGHAEIDADHFAIADCWRQTLQCKPIAMPFQIARLRKLMRNHFMREATLVEATGTTFCACHQREHDSILNLCDDAYGLAENRWQKARALLRDTLPPAVREHIISMDQVAVLIIHTANDSLFASAPRY